MRAFSLFLLLAIGVSPVWADANPALRLERLDGGQESLAEVIGHGRWVIINVWSPSCSLCRQEMPDVIEFHRRHPDIPVLGVTIDFPSFGYGRPEVIRAYLERQPLDFPLYLADTDLVAELLGKRLVAIPLIVIFTPAGKLIASWPGQIDAEQIMTFIDLYDAEKADNPLTRGF